jgi:type VI secretion system secreted protein VgrG
MSGSSGDDEDQTGYVSIKVDPDPGFTLTFDGMTLTEDLGRPFLIQLDLSSGKAKGKLENMLGATVTITLRDANNTKRYFNGILVRASYAGMVNGAYRYHVELRPWIWLLGRVQDCKIFQNQSAWTTITKIFRDAGFTDFSDKRQNQAGETTLDYCVQYRESSLDFVTRLMEQFGIYYFTEHKDGVHTLVLADDPGSHASTGKAISFSLGQADFRSTEDHVSEFTADLNLQSGAFTHRDYNFTTPSADLTAKSMHPGQHKHGSLEVYDYPGPYDVVGDGQKLADVRMQAMTSRQQVFHGKTNSRLVTTGKKFTLSDFTDQDLNQEYLVTRTVISMTMAEGAADHRGELIDSYRVEFEAITGTTHFRLQNQTTRPIVRGPQTAKVVGESGQEITTDQYGRIKVQFYWDRDGKQDENSSCWIRVAQGSAGSGWGSMFIPRIGMEVVVEFLEGNPDRPLVTGVVYNASQTVPYSLPDNKTRSTIKTNSSSGGGGFNELRFEDKKGSEEVFFQAQKDYNVVVLNNETAKIKKDTTTTVEEGNRSVTISQGNDSLTVSQGNLTISIDAGSATIKAAQSITLQVGSNSIKIDTSGVTVTAGQVSTTTTTGAFSVTAGSSVSMTASSSMSLTAPSIALN